MNNNFNLNHNDWMKKLSIQPVIPIKFKKPTLWEKITALFRRVLNAQKPRS